MASAENFGSHLIHDKFSNASAKYYSPNLAVDNIIVFLEQRDILKQYLPSKYKQLWIKSTCNITLKDIYTTREYLIKVRNHELLQSCNCNRTYCKD
jgi:hypothetical protein